MWFFITNRSCNFLNPQKFRHQRARGGGVRVSLTIEDFRRKLVGDMKKKIDCVTHAQSKTESECVGICLNPLNK